VCTGAVACPHASKMSNNANDSLVEQRRQQQQYAPPPPPLFGLPQPPPFVYDPAAYCAYLSLLEKEHCPTCNIRTWMITRDNITGTVRSDALTIPFEVYRGRCLLCSPLPPESFGPTTPNNRNRNNEATVGNGGADESAQDPAQDEEEHHASAAAAAAPEDPVQQERSAAIANREGGGYTVDARPETNDDGDKDVVGEVVIGGSREAIDGPYSLQLMEGALAASGANVRKKPANNAEENSTIEETTGYRNRHLRGDTDPSQPTFSSAIAAEASDEEDGDSTLPTSGKRKRGDPNSHKPGPDNGIGGDEDDGDGYDGDDSTDSGDRKPPAHSTVTENQLASSDENDAEESTGAGTTNNDFGTSSALGGEKQKRMRRDDGPFITGTENGRKGKRRSPKSNSPAASESATSSNNHKQKESQNTAGSAPAQKLEGAITELSNGKRPTKVAVRSLKILLKQCKAAGSSENEAKVAKQIVKLRGVEAILAAMQGFRRSSEILMLGCEILQYICYYDNEAVGRNGIHRCIHIALCAKPDDVRVVQSSIGALQTCAGVAHEIDREIVSGGCLDQVVRSMEEHANVPEIQLNACLFLQDLAAEADPEIITNVLRSGALDSAIRAIKHTKKTDIILAGLAAIGNMPQEELVDSLASLQTFESLKSFLHSSMNPTTGDPAVVAQCCGLLNNLSVETSRINLAVVEAGFIKKTTVAMEAFDNNEDVQCSGCMLLRSLAHGRRTGRSDEIVRDGGLERVFYCLSAYSDNATVLAAALGALRNIEHPEEHGCDIVDTVDRIVKVMENHPDDEEIQEDCCELLRQYMASPGVVKKVEEAQALMAHAADKFPDSCAEIVKSILPILEPPKKNSFSV